MCIYGETTTILVTNCLYLNFLKFYEKALKLYERALKYSLEPTFISVGKEHFLSHPGSDHYKYQCIKVFVKYS